MATNWAAGIGGFTEGLSNGLRMGRQIREIRDEREIRNLSKEGMQEAEANRQKQIDSSISVNGGPERGTGVMAPAATGIEPAAPANTDARGIMDGIANDASGFIRGEKTMQELSTQASQPKVKPMSWTVGGKEYSDRAEAVKAAESQADSVYDFFVRDAAPKIRDKFMAQGKIEQADHMNTWLEERGTKEGMKSWSRALTAAQVGDFDNAAKYLAKAYNAHGYMNDGYQAGKAEVVKDDGGNVTGFKVTFKGGDGKEFVREYNGVEDIITAGLGTLSPQARLQAAYQETLTAKKNKLAANEKATDRANKLADEKKLALFKAGIKSSEIDQREDNLRTRPAPPPKRNPVSQAQLLKMDADANAMMLSSSDPKYRDYKRLPPEQQQKVRAEYLRKQYPMYFREDPSGAAPAAGSASEVNGVMLQDF